MVFQRWQKKTKNIREILEVLKNRLDGASYEDDMMESLNQIYKYTLKYPSDVCDLCMDSVLKSVSKTEDKHLQLQIFQYLYCSSYFKILMNTITSNEQYSEIVLNNGLEFFVQMIRILNPQEIDKIIGKSLQTTKMLKNLVFEDFHFEFRKSIEHNILVRETLVFEGIFEDLIDLFKKYKPKEEYYKSKEEYYKSKEENKIFQIQKDIKTLLIGSVKNQTYFVDNELYLPIIEHPQTIDLEIISILLQKDNKNYKKYQKMLMCIMDDALNLKMYDLVEKLIDFNEETFKMFVENHLDGKIEQIIDDSSKFDQNNHIDQSNDYVNNGTFDSKRSISCLKIIERLIKSTYIEIKSDSSFAINTILFNSGLFWNNLDHILIENLKNKKISISQLIYIIFTRNEIDDIEEMLRYQEYDEPISSFCLFIRILYNKSVRLDPSQIVSKLNDLRLFILKNEITVDSLKETLLETIGQLIVQNTVVFERQKYEMKKVLKSEITYQIPDVIVNTPKSVIIDEVNNKIKGLFDKFKQKDKSSYDL